MIIPIYNEAATVADVLAEVRRHAHGCDVLCVDDGSTDGTADILDAWPGILVLRHERNEGYGRSLIDGFAFAQAGGYSRMASIDCDLQHEPALLPSFMAALERSGADVVSGSRYLAPSPGDDTAPKDRERINRIITERIDGITGWTLTDAFCGLKAYRVRSVARLRLDEPGYAMPLQFWLRAWQAGLVVVERPCSRIYNDSDRSFGADLDFPDRRLAYYQNVIDAELKRMGHPDGGWAAGGRSAS